MAKNPLLIFPLPSTNPRIKKKKGFAAKSYHFPDFSIQKDRLTPQFESMRQSFIVDTTDGLEPESVLVIETCGQIDNFQRAVRAIDGLEWMAEIDEESIESDDIFYQNCEIGKLLFNKKIEALSIEQSSQIWKLLLDNEFINGKGYLSDKGIDDFRKFIPNQFSKISQQIIKCIKDEEILNRKQPLSGRLFLSMSNRSVMDELLNLWNRWDYGDRKLHGFNKWIEIFKQTKEIRKWGVKDRLIDTGIMDRWKIELEEKKGTASKILFEIELWYRKNENKRNEILNKITELISNENGLIIKTCLINEIRFHAIKAELPPESIERVLNHEFTKIFTCDDVMFFRPVGQCEFEIKTDSLEGDFKSGTSTGDPIVAILDGVPFRNHLLLQNKLMFDDPDDFEGDYGSIESMCHGTAMASLICHGEIDANEEPLQRPVYFRPIMKPDKDDFLNNPKRESIPKEYFIEDLIELSVRRIFERENDKKAIAPTIKVINLSIADSTKMYFNKLSSCARLLDWLSSKYQILFCISAGNINTNIELQKSLSELKSLSVNELLMLTMLKIDKDIRNRRILSPADSINSLTIGSIHRDKSTANNIGNRFDILPNQNLPSPVSAHGLGYNNSVKPEIYMPGGRQLYDISSENICKLSSSIKEPGQKVATSSMGGGEINRFIYTRGTSNSAALTTRAAAQIYEMLDSLILENNLSIDENIPVILKTLLVHCASWEEGYSILEPILKTYRHVGSLKKIIACYLGYGIPNINRVLECNSQRATAIGYGKIKKDDAHDFIFPLPPCLSGINEMRRLTITLAWFSPINPASRKYRKANLSVEPPTEKLGVNRINVDGNQVKNGTIQHEVLEGSKVVSYQDGDFLKLSVICREYAEDLSEEVPYGLAVTLEVGENIDLPIYEEIKTRISIPVLVKEKIQ